MWWGADQLATVDAALASSLEGRPVALVVTGVAGMGKSSLLDEVSSRAVGFSLLRAECLPFNAPAAFMAVEQLGVAVDRSSGSGAFAAPLAAQRMREMLDRRLAEGPLVVMIDDVQWADPESVEVLVAVLGRVEAERVLFVLATRPLEPGHHPSFQRLQARSRGIYPVVLDGLDKPAAAALLHGIRPAMELSVVESLWRHTEGNPLYLQTLAREYDELQLAQMRVLPAPAEFASTVTKRLSRMSVAAVSLARATAVLGEGWSSLADAAAVADLDELAIAVDELVDAQLAELRTGDIDLQVRMAHGLVRSAVYQSIPLDVRRALHLRAATVLTGTALVFEHRIAAAVSHDEALADDLERYSAELRGRQDFGSAARFLRSASRVTPDPIIREQRWLESLADSMAATDHTLVRAERAALEQANDRRRSDLIQGLLAICGDWRPQESVRFLEPWSGGEHTDITQYRIEGMLAWARMTSDADEGQIRTALDRAAALPIVDSWVARFVMLTWAQLTARHTSDLPAIPVLASLPADPKQAPIPATGALAWRGTSRSGLGQIRLAIADLTEVTDRIQRGAGGFSSGWYYAVLGRTQWWAGDWARARLSFQAALELSEGRMHPIVAAALPMQAIGEGDLARAAKQIAAAHELLDRVPWREAVDQLVLVEVAREHAEDRTPPDLLARLGPWMPDLLERAPTKSVMWLVHIALSAVWAGELDTALRLSELIVAKPHVAPWTQGIAEWIKGLIAEANGEARTAVNHLVAAVAADLSVVPLYRAHVLTDHARLLHLARGAEAAQPALATAAAIYRTLGARAYLRKLDRLQDIPQPSGSGLRIELSERERDVLTLVVAGMSYAQIARDLFITQRTVGFHLGNIYAKSNVKSRHQLIDLARTQPTVFGLPDVNYARS